MADLSPPVVELVTTLAEMPGCVAVARGGSHALGVAGELGMPADEVRPWNPPLRAERGR
jgi:hypothetical protein